jgi:hypothetical protein
VAFDLKTTVPWGRSLDEYERMFALTSADKGRSILDCGGGPASFNAEMHRQGRHVVSVDPLYASTAGDIRRRIDETFGRILNDVTLEWHRFVWDVIRSPEHLGQVRMAAMEQFLSDLPEGRRAGRYVVGSLPALPFADRQFDLALCSHFLFLYSAQFDLAFHVASVVELLRVVREVRIFPMLDLTGRRSAHVEPLMATMRAQGVDVQVRDVPYEFQRGANQMIVMCPSV